MENFFQQVKLQKNLPNDKILVLEMEDYIQLISFPYFRVNDTLWLRNNKEYGIYGSIKNNSIRLGNTKKKKRISKVNNYR